MIKVVSLSNILYNKELYQNFYFETSNEQDNNVSMQTFLDNYLEYDMESLVLLADGTQYFLLVKDSVGNGLKCVEINSGGAGDPFSHHIDFKVYDVDSVYLNGKNHVLDLPKTTLDSVNSLVCFKEKDNWKKYSPDFDIVGQNTVDILLTDV